MPAGMRSHFLHCFLLAFALAAGLPVHAQVNGVPPSVTSIGFGGRLINGIPPSVTSLGPNGYGSLPFFRGCCESFFLPAYPSVSGHHHRHKNKDKDRDLVGVIEPVYIPYAVEADDSRNDDSPDDDSPDVEYAHGAGPMNADSLHKRPISESPALSGDPMKRAGEPVTAQPSTVLVFKDGHRSEIRNYAVIGDTLFDFAPDRTHKILLADLDLPATHKANDDRGVDFQIPGASR